MYDASSALFRSPKKSFNSEGSFMREPCADLLSAPLVNYSGTNRCQYIWVRTFKLFISMEILTIIKYRNSRACWKKHIHLNRIKLAKKEHIFFMYGFF